LADRQIERLRDLGESGPPRALPLAGFASPPRRRRPQAPIPPANALNPWNPEVIDISIIPTGAGVASLASVSYGALRQFEPDRMGQLALFGTLVGGLGAAGALAIALVGDVL
jgi:hypothetical protein